MMNIHTVAENLRNIIEGREYMLQELEGMKFNKIGEIIANDVTIKFLAANLDELKRILEDVEQCIKDEV